MNKILLIEPDCVLAKIYSQAFAAKGHQVNWQQSAQAAIFAADHHKPDAVVLELRLPEHNGIEFLYEFRSYADWQNVPVILNTFVPPEHLTLHKPQLRALNVAVHLYKPSSGAADLVEAVSLCCHSRLRSVIQKNREE